MKWLFYLNASIGGLCLLVLLTTGTIVLAGSSSQVTAASDNQGGLQGGLAAHSTPLPRGSFSRASDEYEAIATSPLLALHSSPAAVQLPDLRPEFVFHGKNSRPDVSSEQAQYHLQLKGETNKSDSNKGFSEIKAITSKERLYIRYQADGSGGRYFFSPQNAPTSLWIEPDPSEAKLEIHVRMTDPAGVLVTSPESHSKFVLTEKEVVRGAPASGWEIGKIRVDSSLLARQHARWYGKDIFLKEHGDKDETKDQAFFDETHRLDFGESDAVYCCYFREGSYLIWKENRWHSALPGDVSQGYPLMHLKRIEERLMHCELWDVEGKAKVPMTLVKGMVPNTHTHLQNDLKFLGAKTWTQFMVQADGERIILRPKDWLLHTSDGWHRLETVKQIDDYAERRLIGELFVFENMINRDGRQVLMGHLFNAPRTEMFAVELPLQQNSSIAKIAPEKGEECFGNSPANPSANPSTQLHTSPFGNAFGGSAQSGVQSGASDWHSVEAAAQGMRPILKP